MGSNISGFEILNGQGSNFDDSMTGGSLNDTLWGGGGNDAGRRRRGTNQLDGGNLAPIRAVFIGTSSDFTFSHSGGFILATDTTTGEIDYLKNIEDVSFNNGTDTHALSDFIV